MHITGGHYRCWKENIEMTHKLLEGKMCFELNGPNANWTIESTDPLILFRHRNPAICLWAKLKLEP